MDVFAGDRLFYDFLHAKRGISGGIKVPGSLVQSSFLLSPLVHLVNLLELGVTTLFLSTSETLTIWPKEGMTLMFMLLASVNLYPSWEIVFWNDIDVD